MKKSTRICALFTAVSMILSGCGATKAVQENLRIDEHAEADAELEACVDEAFALLQQRGSASEDIWPGYDLDKNAIIVCQREEGSNAVVRAWLLTTTEKTLLTNEDLAGVEIPAAGGYNSLTFDGTKSIILALSESTIPELEKVAITNFIYEIGVHEMVHFHYESPLKLLKLANEQKAHGGRGTAFPKAAEPRAYRKLLYDNLTAAFAFPEEEETYLGRAKYWNEKWKTEFPGEYYQAKVTDIMEGKARYIQYMLCMPGELSREEQAAWISDHFDKSAEPSVSIDSESYKLGFAAGVLLDRRDAGWKKQITKKPEPMVDYLLKDVEIREDTPEEYAQMLALSQAQMARVNEERDAQLENLKQAEENVEIPFLALSEKYLAGSFETSDFLKWGDRNVTVAFGGTFENKNGRIQVKGLSVYAQEDGRKNVYLLPLTMDYEVTDGRLIVNGEGLSGDIRVTQSKNADGRVVYTME